MEKLIKRFIWSLLGNVSSRLNKNTRFSIEELESIKSVLVIRPDRLGDVILSIPIYESIKRSLPKVDLAVLVNSAQAEILKDNPYIDRLFLYHPRRPWRVCGELIRERFDLCIVLNQIFSGTAAAFALCSGAPWRAGYANKPAKGVYNILAPQPDQVKPEVQHNLDVLRTLGLSHLTERLNIHFNDSIKQKMNELIVEKKRYKDRALALIKPGTRLEKWGWRPQNFKKISHQLLNKEIAEVFFICGPGEEDLIHELAGNSDSSPVILPPLTTRELAYLIQISDLLICNHTGIMHLASAVQTPVLAIFKHGDKKRWGPYNIPHVILEELEDKPLEPETVLEEACQLLNSTKPPAAIPIEQIINK